MTQSVYVKAPPSSALPPGPDMPAAAQVYHWIRHPYDFLDNCRRDLGDVFTMKIPRLGEVVLLGHPEAVREVFALGPEDSSAGLANFVLTPFLGRQSMLVLDGAQHQRHRKMMMPAFHGERMHAYGRVMLALTDRAIDALPLGVPVPIHRPMQDVTLQVILRTIFGVAEGERFDEMARLMTEALDIIAWPAMLFPLMHVDLGAWSPWGRFLRLRGRLFDLLREEIARGRQEGTRGRTDVLALMLEARDEHGDPLSEEELLHELLTLLTAGHETSATALSWGFRWLLEDRSLMDRLAGEVAASAGNGPLVPEKIARLEFLDGVVKETLRLNPVIPLVGRVLYKPVTLLGREYPIGTRLAPSIYLVHRRPDLYPEPARFNPDRYRTFKPAPYEWLPFGGGFRRCIGAAFAIYEMKMVLAAMVSRLTMRLPAGQQTRVTRRSITLTPSDGQPVIITSRAPSRRLAVS
jgi:cytochrome P450